MKKKQHRRKNRKRSSQRNFRTNKAYKKIFMEALLPDLASTVNKVISYILLPTSAGIGYSLFIRITGIPVVEVISNLLRLIKWVLSGLFYINIHWRFNSVSA